MTKRKLSAKVLKESIRNEKEIKKYLNKLIKDEIKKMNIIDARGTIRIGDYVFEYEIVGRKVRRISLV